ncbi:MAG: hypothetical protein KJ749_07135, partial [Planctomycetes bacterium]|nr:hypothetical protein [Planctomycetota bacterium]
MFETRLKVLLGIWGIVGIAIVARLAQLQLVRAEYYQHRAEQALHVKPKPMPFVRGSILDRTGRILVNDEPSWDLEIDYDVLAVDAGAPQDQIQAAARRWQKRYPNAATSAQAKHAFLDEINLMWADIAEQFGGDSKLGYVQTLRDRARETYERVQHIRDAVAARRGFDCPVFEETIPHPVVTGLDAQDSIAARETLGRYPWVHVASSSVREFAGDGTPLAHVLGRLGRVSAETVAEDPLADDPFAQYLAHERVGITGVEYAAEHLLRGRRGQVPEDRDGNVVESIIEAEDGKDVTITIHAELQRRLYQLLGEVIQQTPESSGGALVVLDVPTREVLALVSYPSYDPNCFDELYPELRRDTTSLPLRFRAVANQYAPGSVVKPLVCLAGFMSNKITLDTKFECTGSLFPDLPNRWRCWEIHGTSLRKAHGIIGVEEALTGSCNVFMYKLGEQIGVDGLCSAFDMVGVGRSTGIGLREEAPGVNPTPGWLMTYKNSPVYPAHARLFAIGQGEILVTPIQLANLMAVYASGCYRPLTLIRTGPANPEWTLPVTAE